MNASTIIALTRLGFLANVHTLDQPDVINNELECAVENAASQIIRTVHYNLKHYTGGCSIHDVSTLCIGGGHMTTGFTNAIARLGYMDSTGYYENKLFWNKAGVTPDMYAVLVERSL